MKRRIWLVLIAPVCSLAMLVAFRWEFFSSNLFWLAASAGLAVLWSSVIGLLANIYQQLDDNPYYTQMVLKKREEVKALQRAYAEAHGLN